MLLTHRHTSLPMPLPPAAPCLAMTAALLARMTPIIGPRYGLYSSATMLVLTCGNGTHGFTLDTFLGEWVLTHRRAGCGVRK